jgi:hypothetical protein
VTTPSLIFPNGFNPRGATSMRIGSSRVICSLSAIRQVLTAHESGIENVVAFLTENVTALQLEQLVALMDERKCDNLEMF